MQTSPIWKVAYICEPMLRRIGQGVDGGNGFIVCSRGVGQGSQKGFYRSNNGILLLFLLWNVDELCITTTYQPTDHLCCLDKRSERKTKYRRENNVRFMSIHKL